MNRADTWMPLFVADYLKDTGHLTVVEHGAYMLLLMQAWTRGGVLPIEDDRLRTLARMDAKEWKRSKETLLAFFIRSDGVLRHKRIDRELANAQAAIEQRQAAGRASAEARARQREANDRSTAVGTGDPTGTPTDDTTNPATDASTNDPTNGLRKSRPLPLQSKKEESKQAARENLRLPAAPFPEAAKIEICTETGRRLAGGYYIDRTQERVFEAAGIDDTKWMGDIRPLIAWMADGIEPDTIVEAIRKVAERGSYRVPNTLTYFENPVRQAHGVSR